MGSGAEVDTNFDRLDSRSHNSQARFPPESVCIEFCTRKIRATIFRDGMGGVAIIGCGSEWNSKSPHSLGWERLLMLTTPIPTTQAASTLTDPATHRPTDAVTIRERSDRETSIETLAEPAADTNHDLDRPAPIPAPRSPKTWLESGLSQAQLSDLLLKMLFVHGVQLGSELARLTRLPFGVVEEPLRSLRDQRLVEVSSSDLAGRVSYRFGLTESGRVRAHEALEHNRYVGPAPVPLEQYIEHCQLQQITGTRCTPAILQAAFQDIVIRPAMLDQLGPAVCSGKSIFLWGPPGNGKTTIAKGLGRYLNRFANEIYVPYAILVDNCIVTVFDPGIHQTTDDTDLAQRGITAPANGVLSGPVQDGPIDLRWRRVRRPVVVTGNELTLDLLELKYHKPGNFYHAPLQIKANGGLFLIDDLGRQTVRSQDLINRWTIPLEESVDYLTLANGRKCMLPIEQLTVFATNLDPQQVVDEAFMRRIKHKIHIEAPVREQYAAIFQLACRQQEVPYDEAMVEDLLQKYRDLGRTPRSSDPRDLLNMARSICRFHELPFTLNTNLMQDSASRFFDAA